MWTLILFTQQVQVAHMLVLVIKNTHLNSAQAKLGFYSTYTKLRSLISFFKCVRTDQHYLNYVPRQ
jgi:hypothetical protein